MSLSKEPKVISLDPQYIADILQDIRTVGAATGTEDKAEEITGRMQARIDAVSARASLAAAKPKVLSLEWIDPLIYAGHWVPEMVELAGGENCFGSKDEGSGPMDWTEMAASQPEVIIFMPCGFEVKRALQDVLLLSANDAWASLPAVQNQRVYVIDASAYTSRSGPRLVTGLEIMAEMIHPELFSGMIPEAGGIRLFGELVKV
ncbi:MAG: ABC transporter substrate-binding protein [Chloroflexi bacterium]|nr:ABC transporter substrate-binding protein [Chloroflexota bacterium]